MQWNVRKSGFDLPDAQRTAKSQNDIDFEKGQRVPSINSVLAKHRDAHTTMRDIYWLIPQCRVTFVPLLPA